MRQDDPRWLLERLVFDEEAQFRAARRYLPPALFSQVEALRRELNGMANSVGVVVASVLAVHGVLGVWACVGDGALVWGMVWGVLGVLGLIGTWRYGRRRRAATSRRKAIVGGLRDPEGQPEPTVQAMVEALQRFVESQHTRGSTGPVDRWALEQVVRRHSESYVMAAVVAVAGAGMTAFAIYLSASRARGEPAVLFVPAAALLLSALGMGLRVWRRRKRLAEQAVSDEASATTAAGALKHAALRRAALGSAALGGLTLGSEADGAEDGRLSEVRDA